MNAEREGTIQSEQRKPGTVNTERMDSSSFGLYPKKKEREKTYRGVLFLFRISSFPDFYLS